MAAASELANSCRFQRQFSGDLGRNSLISGYNKLVQIISRPLFFLLDTIANVKNVTDTEVKNWKLSGWGTVTFSRLFYAR